MFYSMLKVLSEWLFCVNYVNKWIEIIDRHLEHESTLINTNRTFLTARNRLIAYAPKRACALAVGSGGENKLKLPEPTARASACRGSPR